LPRPRSGERVCEKNSENAPPKRCAALGAERRRRVSGHARDRGELILVGSKATGGLKVPRGRENASAQR